MEARVAVLEYQMKQCRERLQRLEEESDHQGQNHLSRLATAEDVGRSIAVPIWFLVIVVYFIILIVL